MILKSLRLVDFRCYEEESIDFDSKFNVFVGLNGQGKTSIIESIHMLANLKSFRFAKNAEVIKEQKESAYIRGDASHNEINSFFELKVGSHGKQSKVNGKTSKFLTEYLGKLSTVSFCPSDLDIIRGEPEFRRNWIDRASHIYFSNHTELCIQFGKTLVQRNRLLKIAKETGNLSPDVDSWSDRLAHLGAQITHHRLKAVQLLIPHISAFYQRISGRSQVVDFRYISSLFSEEVTGQEGPPSVELISQNLKEKYIQMLSREIQVGTTLYGPHRDDVEVLLNQKSLKAFGSQGEVRTAVLAMKLAEVEEIKASKKMNPILLIDDFSSELDADRRKFLMEYLIASDSQVFITTTETINMGKVFKVSEGKVSSIHDN